MAPRRPTYGIRRGAICKTAGSHVGADTSSHIFGHDQTAPGQGGVLRELSCTHLGHWGFGKSYVYTNKVIACLHQKKKGGLRGGKLFIEILLIVRNVLIINTDWNDKMTKETN